MEIEKIRQQFENHIEKFYPTLPLEIKHGVFRVHPVEQMKDAGSEYKDSGVHLMWLMFLAGAASKEKNTFVSLPPLRDKPENFFDAGYNEGLRDARKHLTSAGIKFKK